MVLPLYSHFCFGDSFGNWNLLKTSVSEEKQYFPTSEHVLNSQAGNIGVEIRVIAECA